MAKVGRNDPCPCGSGKKHKKCCGAAVIAPPSTHGAPMGQGPPAVDLTVLLDRRIRQLHEALGAMHDGDPLSVKPHLGSSPGLSYCAIDFTEGTTEAGLANTAEQLVNNIACLKDHLKAWCARTGAKVDAEAVIDDNQDAAIIHDLWNATKHAELNRPPRSGHYPRIQRLHRPLTLSAGTQAGGSAQWMMDPRTGQVTIRTDNGGSVGLVIDGDVVDEKTGQSLGPFRAICERAIGTWEAALKDAGVPVPSR
ncbi:MAG TPA: SEC-C metal-binding domain-containing protein [Polyangia bacterium]